MSTWFNQNMVYGYRTTHDEFSERVDEDDHHAYDNAMADNNEDGYGWIIDDEFVIYGKIVMFGEDYGNNSIIAAESGIVEMPKLENNLQVNSWIYEEFPDAMPEDIKYYIVGQYS